MGTLATPTAIITGTSPGPSSATIPIASRSPGIASMMSIMRMTMESAAPPIPPAIAPSSIPIESPTATETTPMTSE